MDVFESNNELNEVWEFCSLNKSSDELITDEVMPDATNNQWTQVFEFNDGSSPEFSLEEILREDCLMSEAAIGMPAPIKSDRLIFNRVEEPYAMEEVQVFNPENFLANNSFNQLAPFNVQVLPTNDMFFTPTTLVVQPEQQSLPCSPASSEEQVDGQVYEQVDVQVYDQVGRQIYGQVNANLSPAAQSQKSLSELVEEIVQEEEMFVEGEPISVEMPSPSYVQIAEEQGIPQAQDFPVEIPVVAAKQKRKGYTPKNAGIYSLTEEEKKTMLSEGLPIPTSFPLSKAEEKVVKKIRRKIKNKISAQESRRKKKEYVENLEKESSSLEIENACFQRRIADLEENNASILKEIQNIKMILTNNNRCILVRN